MKGEKRGERWNLAFLFRFQKWRPVRGENCLQVKNKKAPSGRIGIDGDVEAGPERSVCTQTKSKAVTFEPVSAGEMRRPGKEGGGVGHFPSSMDRLLTF